MEAGCGSVKAEASVSIAAGCDPMKVDGLVKMEAGFESARVEAPVGSLKMEPGGGFSKRLKLPGTRRPGDAGFVLASSWPSIFPSLKPKVRRSSLSTRGSAESELRHCKVLDKSFRRDRTASSRLVQVFDTFGKCKMAPEALSLMSSIVLHLRSLTRRGLSAD
ncbi:uncharacterized protein LOC112343276 isoform X2 [Selaginella moellendorffii]|uniref:uncharacterized protein LOC112343276 isoform X2 n=1 Tax=Selaginella moellendorffii TaxID=88036 RepID=UPI000D1CE8FA|nr:uncharacterized protein LOC112343276 isoform X2 [Selaginella moellendorffii]|eukprot:XP_024522218.1 uncharacterized protein LOC112343276 isoform X2 [Selaginella moellendorffii]